VTHQTGQRWRATRAPDWMLSAGPPTALATTGSLHPGGGANSGVWGGAPRVTAQLDFTSPSPTRNRPTLSETDRGAISKRARAHSPRL
jgi:hypothetical protein